MTLRTKLATSLAALVVASGSAFAQLAPTTPTAPGTTPPGAQQPNQPQRPAGATPPAAQQQTPATQQPARPATAPATQPPAAQQQQTPPRPATAQPAAPAAQPPAAQQQQTPPRPATAQPAAPAAQPPAAQQQRPAAAPAAAAPAAAQGAMVNLNTADRAALDTLPQIGEARANAIISERTRNGRFRNWEDFERRMAGTSVNQTAKDAIRARVTF